MTEDDEFDAFCAGAHPRLVAALAHLSNSPLVAEELAQEALIRAYLHWPRVRNLDSPLGWTYRVGSNLATSRWRRSRVERRAIARLSRAQPPETTDPGLPTDSELISALATLTDKQRQVVIMRYVLDLSVDQTASSLDLRSDAVRQLAHRATTRLRTLLGSDPETVRRG